MNNTLHTLNLACAAVALSAVGAYAVDQAAVAADLAGTAVVVVQSKAGLADAASGGNIDAIAEAAKQSDAIDAAMAEGQDAYAAMERAIESGDEDAAQAAADDVKSSLAKAIDAANGVIPEEVVDAVKQWKESATNTGGGPGKPYDPPNMYDVAWDSAGMQSFYQNHFGNVWSSGRTPGDKDATPE